MADIHVRSDAVDVEQIMRQIRARIREKRGVDYTEAELQQLASVKLEKFLDPRGVRSDLVEQFRKHRTVSAEPPTYEFEDTTLYETHRGLLRTIRKLLNPILKLFVNPNPLIHALHVQKQVNEEFHRRFRQREEMDPLFYEVIHNLVVEVTRAGIEVQNLKMRVESLSSRMDFDERRARSLEGAVQYRQPVRQAAAAAAQPVSNGGPTAGAPASAASPQQPSGGNGAPSAPSVPGVPGNQQGPRPDGERRRRRRRRRRRPGQTLGDQQAAGGAMAAGHGQPDERGAGPIENGGDEGDGPDEGFDGPDEGGSDEGAGDQ
jgi:hypothetical protein